MANKFKFQGTIVRLEREGFGIVEFDAVVGSSTHGIFSTSISEPTLPFGDLKPGMHVTGTAEADERDLAAVKTLQIEPA